MTFSMRLLPSISLPVMLCAMALAGCAGTQERPASEDPPPFSSPAMTMPQARDAITPGASTREQVIAALGNGAAIRFDSGWEVRLYRDRRTDPNISPAELAVLFSPAGVAQKVRVKPAYRLPAQ